MHVNSGDLNFVPGPCNINLVSEKNNFFLARDPARRDWTWGLLESNFLEIAVD
jgi:hypothetical protein